MTRFYILYLLLSLSYYSFSQPDSNQKKEIEEVIKAVDREIELVKAYITDIANNEIPDSIRIKKIEKVLKKFSAEATIDVTSKNNNDVKKFKARRYFYRLKDELIYSKVAINWIKNPLIEKVHCVEISEDRYELNGRFIQKFEGFDEHGKRIYEDVTIKKLIVDVYKDKVGPEEILLRIKIIRIDAETTMGEEEFHKLFGLK